MRYSNSADQIGSKLGPKLVKLVSDAVVATKLKLLDTEHRARVHSMQTVIDRAGREIADLIRPVFSEALKDQDMPDEVRAFIEKSMSGHHQWQSIAGMVIGYSGAGSTLSQIISNTLAPVTRELMSRRPELLPDNATLAQLYAKGIIDGGYYNNQSAGQGWDAFISSAVTEGFQGLPDLSTTLELLRRGKIDSTTARFFLRRNSIHPAYFDELLSLEKIPLSPADLADMVVRGIKTHADAARTASESGVDAGDFDALVLDTGEPLALEQLLEAYRRGFINRDRLVRGIRQSRIRDEWIDVAEKIRFSPMSVADAVNAVVQNHLSAAAGSAIAEQNGLIPGAFDTLIKTAGEPLSRTEMEQLYNRGLVTQAQVNQALLESRVKNKYVNLAFQLHKRIMPVNYVQRALRYGAISHADAVTAVMDNGFTKHDAEILVTSGSAEKLQTYKNRVVSAVETAYEENTITRDEAIGQIKGMGFEQSEAEFVVKASEFRRNARIQNQAIGLIRGRYTQHRLSRQQTSNDLDSIGIPAPQRDYMLHLWDIEHAAHTRDLTEAQVIRAMKKQTITPDQALKRLLDMGYSDSDAKLLVEDA